MKNKYFKLSIYHTKKGFTLIELIVVMAIIGVLVLLATPKFIGYAKKAEYTKIIYNNRQLESISELYYMKHSLWPVLSEKPYTANNIKLYSKKILDKTGQIVELDENGTYYSLDYTKLQSYIQKPKDGFYYIIQNPVGDIFYLSNLTKKGEEVIKNLENSQVHENPEPIIGDYKIKENEDGTITIKEYLGSDTEVQIPSSINNKLVKVLDTNAFANKNLIFVMVPNSIESINNNTFYNNPLIKIDIGSNIKFLQDSFTNEFYRAYNVTNQSNGIYIKDKANNWVRQEYAISEYSITENSDGTLKINDYFGTNTTLSIPSTVGGKTITIIGKAAFKDNSLTYVNIPNSIIALEPEAFIGNSLTTVFINSNLNIDKTSISDTFFNLYNTNKINGEYKSNYQSGTWYRKATIDDYTTEDNGDGTLKIVNYNGTDPEISIPDFINGKVVTTIGANAFKSKKLKSVVIPDSVISIEDYAFQYNDLSYVKLSSNLITINKHAFEYNKLTNIDIPSKVQTIGDKAFSVNLLTSITIPNNVTTMGFYTFHDNKLTSVYIGSGLNKISANPFLQNPTLTSITVDANNLKYKSINNGLYSGTTLISGTKVMSNYIYSETISIGDCAFYGMGVTSVTIPNKIAYINNHAFYNNQLTSVILPNSIITLGPNTFKSNQLTSVTIGSNVNVYDTAISTNFYNTYNNAGKLAGTYTSSAQDNTWIKK